MILIAVAAISGWAYWIGWPRWQLYREQWLLLEGLKRLHVGITEAEIDNASWMRSPRFQFGASYFLGPPEDANSDAFLYFVYEWPDRLYLALTRFSYRHGVYTNPNHCIGVEVFQLALPPDHYEAHTESGRNKVLKMAGSQEKDRAKSAYIYDFFEFKDGDRKNNPGFEYELIYSDPPEN